MRALIVLPLLLVAGCATDYKHYADAIAAQARYQAIAETERASAMRAALTADDPVARAVAANGMAIADALRAVGAGGRQTMIAPPKSLMEEAAQFVGAFSPWVAAGAQVYATKKGADVAIAQSTNAANVAMSTNATFSNIAASGFATASTLGSKPTIGTINGDGNALFGSTTTQTTTVNCPQTTTASTGQAGSGAPGGTGGAADNGAQAGNGATGGAGGASGTSMPQATVNCVAGRK